MWCWICSKSGRQLYFDRRAYFFMMSQNSSLGIERSCEWKPNRRGLSVACETRVHGTLAPGTYDMPHSHHVTTTTRLTHIRVLRLDIRGGLVGISVLHHPSLHQCAAVITLLVCFARPGRLALRPGAWRAVVTRRGLPGPTAPSTVGHLLKKHTNAERHHESTIKCSWRTHTRGLALQSS